MILDFVKLFKMYSLFTLSILMKLKNLDQRLLGCLMRDSLIYFGGTLEAPHGINKGYSVGHLSPITVSPVPLTILAMTESLHSA